MLPEILENIIKWNDIAQVPSNNSSMELYKNLITEEYTEFVTAFEKNKLVSYSDKDLETEELDGIIDMVWVIIGYARARGWSNDTIYNAFKEVERSNYSKFVLETTGKYKCIKRDDGKILKPDTFSKAELRPIIDKNIYVSY